MIPQPFFCTLNYIQLYVQLNFVSLLNNMKANMSNDELKNYVMSTSADNMSITRYRKSLIKQKSRRKKENQSIADVTARITILKIKASIKSEKSKISRAA